MSVTRRVWSYGVTFVALGLAAAGVGVLLALLLGLGVRNRFEGGFGQQQFSLGLAMLVIGVPLWFFFWRSIQGRVRGSTEEIGSALRKLFLNLVLFGAALTFLISAMSLLEWVIGGAPSRQYSPGELSTLIVAAAIWLYHFRVSETEGHPSPDARTLRRWYVYLTSEYGLVVLAVSCVLVLSAAILTIPALRQPFSRGFWTPDARSGIAGIVAGGAFWYFHWFRMARGDYDSTLRQVYFYLVAILGGAVAALVALVYTLDRIFFRAFGGAAPPGAPIPVSGGPYWRFLGWAVPTMLVGVAVWAYHRWLVQREAAEVSERRLSARRVHLYLITFLGLGALIGGVIALLGLPIDAAVLGETARTGWWRTQLSIGLALLPVGAVLWAYCWARVSRWVVEGGLTEWRAASRRIFLYAVVGIAIVTLAADLVNIVYQLLIGMLQGHGGASVLRGMKWSLQTLVPAAVVLWYHWRVMRREQRLGAEAGARHKAVTLLAGGAAGDLAARIEGRLGFKVRTLYRVGETAGMPLSPSDEEIARLAEEVQAAPGDRVIVLALEGRLSVVPYRET